VHPTTARDEALAALRGMGERVTAPRAAVIEVLAGTVEHLSAEEVAESILPALTKTGSERRAEVGTDVAEAEFTTKDARALQIKEEVSSFVTYYPHAEYRNVNQGRAAELISGTVLKPGETFSFNDTVGERTEENGFVPGFIISNGVFQEDLGGGVSQVVTTTYNAAFFAGLEDVEHKPHSFYISRYPPGRESTVYYGAIDVKVRNDTAHGLLVRTSSTPGSVTVRLYGDNGGRRVTSTSGPRRPLPDGGFRIEVTRTTTGGDGQGGRRVFRTTYEPVPPEE